LEDGNKGAHIFKCSIFLKDFLTSNFEYKLGGKNAKKNDETTEI